MPTLAAETTEASMGTVTARQVQADGAPPGPAGAPEPVIPAALIRPPCDVEILIPAKNEARRLSEIGRARLRTGSRRQASDLSTVAWWPPGDADAVEEPVRRGLRVTDVLRRDEDGIRVLFTGCDEMTAARALERVPVPPAKLYLAATVQVLRASGEGGLE